MKKIVIIGPESTGKSTLATQLASEYHSVWVPEFARTYLMEHGTSYTFEDLLAIAKGQLELEDSYSMSLGNLHQHDHEKVGGPFLFIDTDMYVMKVWCEFVFEKCHQWILDQIVKRSYDLYLLCNIDLPWVKDELREYPELILREKLYHIYRDMMVNQSVPWVDISGDYAQRFQRAREGISKHLS